LPESDNLIGISLPELATILCKNLVKDKKISYEQAKLLFKEEICKLSNWLPSSEKVEIFKDIFDFINPSWIITTNYDLVLETILTGKCKILNSNNYLSAPRGVIPIYHIHGIRLDPKSIIITQDDYIPLFRPNEYRQSKLATTIRESTTLVLGYGLGDINVLSALDWSKNIYANENEYPHDIIQLYRTSSPKEHAYRDENGNLILEIDEIENFLIELVNELDQRREIYNNKLEELEDLIGELKCEDSNLVIKFIKEENFRSELLEKVSEFEYNMMHTYIEFFTRCLDEVWEETSINGAFEAYNKYLRILLDIIINYEYNKMPPRLFQIVAEALNKVFYYVGRGLGDSWAAKDTWEFKKRLIPDIMLNELNNYAQQNRLNKVEEYTEKVLSERCLV
ncbi:MAG: SIR2 family NAD-dependent protein deacylase, partial [Paeniclostridium sp.]